MTAVVLALLAALSFATATVVQHRAVVSAQVAPGRWRAARLVLRVLGNGAWLAGQAAGILGFLFHALALRAGPVVLVQPVLSSGLVLSLALGALVDRRHPGRRLPDRVEWLSAGVVVVGLTLFLIAARPAPGILTGRVDVLAVATVATVLLGATSWWWSSRPGARHRALVLGVAAGVGFGVTGVLLKQVVAYPIGTWWHEWSFWALVVVGGMAVPTAQAAYRAGRLIESLPTMTVLEPVVAIVLASAAFGESLAGGWAARTGQVVGMVLLAAGVISLARRQAAIADAETRGASAPR